MDFTTRIEQFSETQWLSVLDTLLPSIHPVDRDAVQIWFRFNPLDLVKYLESSDDLEDSMKGVAMQGNFGLLDKIDSSHRFLYGHRFWPQVKLAIQNRTEAGESFSDLAAEIKRVASDAATAAKTDTTLTTAISAVGLMTLAQTGADNFMAARGSSSAEVASSSASPDAIVANRAKDDSQGVFGFLKTVDKKFTVSFSAASFDGSFPIINDEEVVSASQKSHEREWQTFDSRCWDGPIPIECTSASCGTCWVGVLGGKEKLSSPSDRERRQMKVFGYNQPDDEKPFLRLACQAKAHGNVTVTIPEWNAVFGKKVRANVDELDLEPVTTSAAKLREVVKEITDPK